MFVGAFCLSRGCPQQSESLPCYVATDKDDRSACSALIPVLKPILYVEFYSDHADLVILVRILQKASHIKIIIHNTKFSVKFHSLLGDMTFSKEQE